MKELKTKKLENGPCFNGQNEDKNSPNQGMKKCMKGAKKEKMFSEKQR